ncbi:Rso55 protein [Martiniozyma asiatica (nom. inval.)]|nr:Rso55 protein [Martiniozyma asiatica]
MQNITNAAHLHWKLFHAQLRTFHTNFKIFQIAPSPSKSGKKLPRANKMPPRPKPPPETDIKEKFIKGGSGHGGQKINKTNSKVQLTHIPTGLVVTSQATRSREQNRKIAREIMAQKLENIEKGEDSRQSIVAAVKRAKRNRSDRKKRKKYRLLEEAKGLDQPQGSSANKEEIVIIFDEDSK